MSERKDMWIRDGEGDNGSLKLRPGMQLFFDGDHLQLCDMTVGSYGIRVCWPLRGEDDDFKTRTIKFLRRQQDFAEFCETVAALCGLSIEKLELPPDAPSWLSWESRCTCLFGELKTETESPKVNDATSEVK